MTKILFKDAQVKKLHRKRNVILNENVNLCSEETIVGQYFPKILFWSYKRLIKLRYLFNF